jgi:phosphate regulon transcriptional regulator PhoB
VARRIVIIEDELDIIELVRYNFEKEGFEVASFAQGKAGLEHLRRDPPDLLLLDIMLPDGNGMEICRAIRADPLLKTLPIIFLTARGEEVDRVLGLEMGGDDYVVKPFSPRELVSRVKAVLRRREQPLPEPVIVKLPGLQLDARTQELTVRGKIVELSSLEFRLLSFLASHPRQVFTREQLLDSVWGPNHAVTPRTIDVHVRRLREKIEEQADEPKYIQAVRGIGYRFSAQSSA